MLPWNFLAHASKASVHDAMELQRLQCQLLIELCVTSCEKIEDSVPIPMSSSCHCQACQCWLPMICKTGDH
jgi:hypothetical protein